MKTYLRKHLQKHTIYQSARQEFSKNWNDLILLDANENPFDLPYNRYPDPLQLKLRKAISTWRNVPPSQIYLGNGSDEIINQLVLGFCEPNEEKILICPPTFGMYKVAAELFQVPLYQVPLTSQFQLDVPAILQSIKPDMKLFFLPTPNNPTGNRFKTEDIQKIASAFPGIVVVDEAYAEFSPEASALSWQSEYPNIVVLQTFSKAQGMAGARLGMAFGSENIIDGLLKVKAPYNLNSLTLDAALDQVENQQRRVSEMVALLTKERKRVTNALESLPYVESIFPSDANFFMLRVDDSRLRYNQLIENNIVVRQASHYLGCENCLRISVGEPSENDKLLQVMNNLK